MKKTCLFAVLLSMILMIGLLPASAFADNTNGKEPHRVRLSIEDGTGYVEITTEIGNALAYEGETVELVFHPASGYHFDSATLGKKLIGDYVIYPDGNKLSGNTFTMPDEDVYIRVRFISDVAIAHTVTFLEAEHGSVYLDGDKDRFYEDDTVKLVVVPERGWTLDTLKYAFVNRNVWASISNNRFVMPDADVQVQATFKELTKFNINASPDEQGGGSVTGAGTWYIGEEVTLTAVPEDGWAFIRWIEDGKVIGKDPVLTFTAAEDRTLTAVFRSKTSAPILKGFKWSSDQLAYAISEKQYMPTYTAAEMEWDGVAPEDVTTSLKGFYDDKDFTIPTSEKPQVIAQKYYFYVGAKNKNPDKYVDFSQFDTANLDVTMRGFKLTLLDVVTESDGIRFYYIAEKDFNYFTITTEASPAEGGTTEGGGRYLGGSITIKATPNKGYRFVKWTEDGYYYSGEEEYEVEVYADDTYTAVFEKIDYTNTEPEQSEHGKLYFEKTAQIGDKVKVVAIPDEGYEPEKVIMKTEDGKETPVAMTETDPGYWEGTYTMPAENVSLKATFVLKQFTVTFLNDGGAVLQTGKVEYGTMPAYTGKTPEKQEDEFYKYTFKGWTPKFAKVKRDVTYTAVYEATAKPTPTPTPTPPTPTPTPVPKGKIRFDLGGGTLNGKTELIIEAEVGETIIMPDAPTRKGYSFEYWKGSVMHPGDEYIVEGDHDFTAVWKVIIDPKKADNDTSPKTGDENPMEFWAIVFAMSAVLLVAIIASRRLKKR